MLHTIIFIQRTGSTTFSSELANSLGAILLGEIMHPHRHESIHEYSVNFNKIITELVSRSISEDIVVKFHINDITRIWNNSRYYIKHLFNNSYKLYYPIRLDYIPHIISMIIAQKTLEWGYNRNTSSQMKIIENDIYYYSQILKRLLAIQGEWHKQYPGELVVLENRVSNPYPKYDIKITGLKSFLKKNPDNDYSYLFPKMDIMETFNNGNKDYKII